MNLQESIRRILRENDYSPAGKEVIPNKIVVHKSNPMFRDKILQDGLKVKAGECYKIYVGYGTKCKPAIFATNSTNKKAWFDSTYYDDVWEINTEMIPDVKWFKDRHYESRSKHIVTFQDIPREAISLKYKGSGSGDAETWDKNSPNLFESIRRILREETKLPDYIRRRVTANDLERLVRDVKISISGGKDKSDALYDAIQNFISSNRKQFKDYKWLHSNNLPSLIKYINSKLDEEPLNESILREESKPIPMIRRRVPNDELEKEFSESLDMSSNMLRNTNKDDGSIMSLNRFIDVTISILMDGIHYELYSTMPEDSQWYGDAIESLKDYYKDRIKSRYKKLVSNT